MCDLNSRTTEGENWPYKVYKCRFFIFDIVCMWYQKKSLYIKKRDKFFFFGRRFFDLIHKVDKFSISMCIYVHISTYECNFLFDEHTESTYVCIYLKWDIYWANTQTFTGSHIKLSSSSSLFFSASHHSSCCFLYKICIYRV